MPNPDRPRRRAVLCGIAGYGPPYGNLSHITADLAHLERVLHEQLDPEFRYDDVKVYSDKQLTKEGLETLLYDLTQVESPVDDVFLFLAGHGSVRRGTSYFVTYGSPLNDPGVRTDTLAADLFKSKTRSLFAVFDFCYSGALPEAVSDQFGPPRENERLAILACARAGELAAAGDGFSQYVTEALTQAMPDAEGYITWDGVLSHVTLRMKRSVFQRVVDRTPQALRHRVVNRVPVPSSYERPAATAGFQSERRLAVVVACRCAQVEFAKQAADPEDAARLEAAYSDAFLAIATKYEATPVVGYPTSFLYFGGPKGHEDDKLRAVNAALELVATSETLDHYIAPLAGAGQRGLHIGIDAGVAYWSGGTSGQIRPIGPTSAIADGLSSAAPVNAVLLSAGVHRDITNAFECSEFVISQSPARAFRVMRPRNYQSRFELTTRLEVMPIVGRELELQQLRTCWGRAGRGQGQIAVVVGQAGIGKSRLVREVAEEIRAGTSLVIQSQCWEATRNVAFAPLITLMQEVAGVGQDDSPEQRLEKLEHMVVSHGLAASEVMPYIALSLGMSVASDHVTPAWSPDRARQKALEALLTTIIALLSPGPALLLIEDTHWADPSTVEVLGMLAARVGAHRIFLLLTARPEFRPGWLGGWALNRVPLFPLLPEEAKTLIGIVAAGRELSSDLANRIFRKADGIPLYLQELTRVAVDADPDRSAGPGAPAEIELPAGLGELPLLRLDRTGPAKYVAQVAAVIGNDIRFETLAHVWDVAKLDIGRDADLNASLDSLVENDFLLADGFPPTARYRFRHALIQDAVYESVPRKRRRLLHQAVLALFEAATPGGFGISADVLARHAMGAGDRQKAAGYWSLSGEAAQSRQAFVEASQYFTLALQQLDSFEDEQERRSFEMGIQKRLGDIYVSLKSYGASEVEVAYARVRDLAGRDAAAPDERFKILRGLWGYYGGRAELSAAIDVGQQLLEIAKQRAEPILLTEAHRALGSMYTWRGDFTRARHHLAEGLATYSRDRSATHVAAYGIDAGVVCLIYKAWVEAFSGSISEARKFQADCLELAEQIAHPFTTSFAYTFSAWLFQFLRDPTETRRLADRSIDIAEDLGFLQWLTWARILRGWALAQEGKTIEALTVMRRGLAEARDTGSELGRPAFLALEAQMYHAVGDTRSANAALDEALTVADMRHEYLYRAELYRLHGVLGEGHGDVSVDKSARRFESALRFAREQNATLFELRTLVSILDTPNMSYQHARAVERLTEISTTIPSNVRSVDIEDMERALEAAIGLCDRLPVDEGGPRANAERNQ